MPRIVITLGSKELDALVRLAAADLRSPQDQVRFLVRQELERLNLLQLAGQQAESSTQGANDGKAD